MATPTTGRFILERLADWGVKQIYGYPGDGINGLLGGFHEVGDRIGFVQVCMVPAQAQHLVDRAVRVALASRTVAAIIVPNDVQEEPYEEPARAHGSVFSSIGWDPPRIVPPADTLQRAADVLNAGEK